jgi:hypothetical protein
MLCILCCGIGTNIDLQTFLGMNFAITGVPLFLFVLFSLTVFIFALVVGLLVGVLGAVAFTLFAVGLALTVVLPTVFFTTMGATFLFLWGLGGYYALKWANGESESSSSEGGSATIGDRLNSLSGGRLTGFMSAAKKEESKKDISGYGDEHTPATYDEKPQKPKANGAKSNGSPSPQKGVNDASKAASDASKAATEHAKKATNATKGAQNAVGSTTGTVTGGLSGATGTG